MYLNSTSFQTYPLGESLCADCSVRNDMAVIHRFHTYVPGWGIPPKSSTLLTTEYGLITDCLVEAYQYIVKRINLYATIKGGIFHRVPRADYLEGFLWYSFREVAD